MTTHVYTHIPLYLYKLIKKIVYIHTWHVYKLIVWVHQYHTCTYSDHIGIYPQLCVHWYVHINLRPPTFSHMTYMHLIMHSRTYMPMCTGTSIHMKADMPNVCTPSQIYILYVVILYVCFKQLFITLVNSLLTFDVVDCTIVAPGR